MVLSVDGAPSLHTVSMRRSVLTLTAAQGKHRDDRAAAQSRHRARHTVDHDVDRSEQPDPHASIKYRAHHRLWA
jgi:hypothetical protein